MQLQIAPVSELGDFKIFPTPYFKTFLKSITLPLLRVDFFQNSLIECVTETKRGLTILIHTPNWLLDPPPRFEEAVSSPHHVLQNRYFHLFRVVFHK